MCQLEYMSRPDNHTIENVLQNRGTSLQSKQVSEWFLTDEGVEYLAERMDSDISHPSFPLIPTRYIPFERVKGRLAVGIRRRAIRRKVIWAAAILIPFTLLLSMFVFVNNRVELFAKESFNEMIVPADEQLSLVFQDGSKVRLNAGTKIRFPKQFGLTERRVFLEGEGFFEITTNTKRHFVVETPNLNIKVTGTSFNVDATPGAENVVVHLYSGEVELNSRTVKKALLPRNIATYHIATGKMRVVESPDEEKTPGWVSKHFRFFNTPLPEVLSILSKAYNVRFDITDPSLNQVEYTLMEQNVPLEAILSDMEKISPIKARRLENRIEIQPSTK